MGEGGGEEGGRGDGTEVRGNTVVPVIEYEDADQYLARMVEVSVELRREGRIPSNSLAKADCKRWK